MNVMEHVDCYRASFHDRRRRQFRSPPTAVDVPPHRDDGRQLPQRREDFRLPNVTGVNDQL